MHSIRRLLKPYRSNISLLIKTFQLENQIYLSKLSDSCCRSVTTSCSKSIPVQNRFSPVGGPFQVHSYHQSGLKSNCYRREEILLDLNHDGRIWRRCYCTNKPIVPKDGGNLEVGNTGGNRILKEVEGSTTPLGKVEPSTKMFLSFTCTVCHGSNSFTISKRAYYHGVVIVTCQGCSINHLIADNLDWFSDVEGKNIEEIMAKKGEKVRKFLSSDVNEIEPQ